jgi:hypothetical protein
MDYEEVKRLLWGIAVALWLGILAIVWLAPTPECHTDMECELLHGPGDLD